MARQSHFEVRAPLPGIVQTSEVERPSGSGQLEAGVDQHHHPRQTQPVQHRVGIGPVVMIAEHSIHTQAGLQLSQCLGQGRHAIGRAGDIVAAQQHQIDLLRRDRRDDLPHPGHLDMRPDANIADQGQPHRGCQWRGHGGVAHLQAARLDAQDILRQPPAAQAGQRRAPQHTQQRATRQAIGARAGCMSRGQSALLRIVGLCHTLSPMLVDLERG